MLVAASPPAAAAAALPLVEVLALLANPDLTPALERLLGQPDDDAHEPVITARRQKQRRLAPDQIDDLLVKYVEGTSVLALAEEYDVHRTTIMEILEREGIPRRPCTRSMTDDDVARAAAQYASGQSLAIVGGAFGVSPRTVAREFARAGIATRPQPGAR